MSQSNVFVYLYESVDVCLEYLVLSACLYFFLFLFENVSMYMCIPISVCFIFIFIVIVSIITLVCC